MNLHPTPFPGKRRPSANLATKNGRDRDKPAASLAQSKPKRTFGRNLSGNIIMVEKKPVPAKPWKPSGVSKKILKPPGKLSSALPCAAGAKSDSSKKLQHVTFREIKTLAAEEDFLLATPVFSAEHLMQETPYKSAENCSNCRLDRLETSSYWISEIKLAEHTGKHFVSAAFFRLALDCKAQPFVSLQNELKHYRDRHGLVFTETLWGDLWRDYGLSNDQLDSSIAGCDTFDAVLVEQFNSKCTVSEQGENIVSRDISVGYDIIEKPEDLEAKTTVPEEIVIVEHSDVGLQEVNSLVVSISKNVQDVENLKSNYVLSGDARRSVSIGRNKSKVDDFTSNDSSFGIKTNMVNIFSQKVRQAGTKNFGTRATWKKESEDVMESSDMLKSKSNAEEQCLSIHQDESVNPVEEEETLKIGEKANFNQF